MHVENIKPIINRLIRSNLFLSAAVRRTNSSIAAGIPAAALKGHANSDPRPTQKIVR